MHQVKPSCPTAKGEPVSLETINVPDPGPGEALVKVQACGVCHTDLHYREGGINDEFPFLLGHEAAGVVEAVGDDVTSVAPGDFVVLNWRAVCGDCRACNRGEPWYCFDTHNADPEDDARRRDASSARRSGSARSPRRPWSPPASAPRSTRPRRAAAVGLLGCGVMAGLGAAINTGNVEPRHDASPSSAAAGSARPRSPGPALAGASKIIAVDIDDRKLETATRLGATHTVNSTDERPGRGDQEDLRDRRSRRRRRRDRRGRPARDLEAGVLRPRPRRHGRPGRRTHARHEDPRHPADRRVRPRRRR